MHPSGYALRRSQLPLQGSLPGGRRPKCAAAGVNARPTMQGKRAVERGRQAAARFGGTMRALPPAGGVSERSRYEVLALSAEIAPYKAQGRVLPGFAGYLCRKAAMHPSGCALRRIQLPLQGSLFKRQLPIKPPLCRRRRRRGAAPGLASTLPARRDPCATPIIHLAAAGVQWRAQAWVSARTGSWRRAEAPSSRSIGHGGCGAPHAAPSVRRAAAVHRPSRKVNCT